MSDLGSALIVGTAVGLGASLSRVSRGDVGIEYWMIPNKTVALGRLETAAFFNLGSRNQPLVASSAYGRYQPATREGF